MAENWTNNASYRTEPPTAKKNRGLLDNEKPAAKYLNWLFWWIFDKIGSLPDSLAVDSITNAAADGPTDFPEGLTGDLTGDSAGTHTGAVQSDSITDEVGTGASIHPNGISTGDASLLVKVVNIGDWNMDSTTGLQVAHGLTQSKIRQISALIRQDDDSFLYILGGTSTTGSIQGRIYAGSTEIYMERSTGGSFDGTNFDSTSFNRGWITIWYVP